MSFRDFPLRYDRRGGSLKMFLSCGWFCIKCHFPMSIFFKLGNAGWYCVTKGRIFFCAVLFLFVKEVFLSENLTWERCFSTVVVGYPLLSRRVAKFLMFSSKVVFEEFVLRSLKASPLMKPLVTPGGWHEWKSVYWKVSVGLKYVRTSSIDSLRNLSPLYTTVSKKIVSVSDISAVNFIVGWKLFAFKRNSSILSLLVSHIDMMSSINSTWKCKVCQGFVLKYSVK